MKMRLFSKLMLYILCPAVLGFCAMSTVSYMTARNALKAQIHEELQLLSSRQQSEIDTMMSMMQGAMRSLAEMPRILAVLQDGTGAESGAAARDALGETARNFTLIQECGVIDPQGVVLAHTNAEMLGKNRADRAYFAKALRGETAAESVKSQATGKYVTILAAPVRKENRIVGVVYLTLDMENIQKDVIDSVKIGRTGVSFVYTADGVLLMHPKRNYVNGEDGKLPWVRTMLRQKQGDLEYVWDGKKKLLYFSEVPQAGWFVCIAVVEEDIFAPAAAMLQRNMLTAAGCILVVGLIIFLVSHNLAATIRGGVGLLRSVAAGKLRLSPEEQALLDRDCGRGDEIGDMAQGVRDMVRSLGTLFEESAAKTREAEQAGKEARVAMAAAEAARRAAENARREGMLAAAGQLESVVSIVSSASTQLSAQIEQSERGAAEQAARVTETATAMEEMNTTVAGVAGSAGKASEVSAGTRRKAAEGADIVRRSMDSMRQVREESSSLKEQMQTLEQHATSINRIMGVISDIADQTNLLALNAAIEAARAGDAGRGFAVVADEVRKLAEKTMTSTTDVGDAIKAIQNSTDRSRGQVDRAVQVIEQANGYARQSGEALEQIVDMADSTADQVRAIAAASEQQSAASEEINRSINQVNTIATENARAMEEAARAVGELAEQARVLSGMIETMKRG